MGRGGALLQAKEIAAEKAQGERKWRRSGAKKQGCPAFGIEKTVRRTTQFLRARNARHIDWF